MCWLNYELQGEIEDYQGSKKKEFKNFKENLVSFWDNLVTECQNGPLFDKDLFDKCMDYIIALSWLVHYHCEYFSFVLHYKVTYNDIFLPRIDTEQHATKSLSSSCFPDGSPASHIFHFCCKEACCTA